MKINCIAIEDEPIALKKITDFINQVDYLYLLKGFDNAIDAHGFIKQNDVDLIFLDIRMKSLSGIQFLESVKPEAKIIITSAYGEYALQAYEFDVADYLLKPFSFERFLKSAEKVYEQLKNTDIRSSKEFIFVKTEYRIEKVRLDEILFIQGMKDYLQIHTRKKRIMTLQTFKNMIEILSENDFQRVHNSYIVSISKIDHIEKNRIYIGNTIIPISDSYKKSFYKLLNDKNILI